MILTDKKCVECGVEKVKEFQKLCGKCREIDYAFDKTMSKNCSQCSEDGIGCQC